MTEEWMKSQMDEKKKGEQKQKDIPKKVSTIVWMKESVH